MHVLMRDATATDAAALADLVTQLGYPTAAGQMERRLTPLIADADTAALVADADGAVIGMIGVQLARSFEFDGVQGRIVALAVDDAHRGRGIGRRLVEAGEAWSGARGAVKMMVNTASHRAAAHAFYGSLGYEMTGLRFVKQIGGMGASPMR